MVLTSKQYSKAEHGSAARSKPHQVRYWRACTFSRIFSKQIGCLMNLEYPGACSSDTGYLKYPSAGRQMVVA